MRIFNLQKYAVTVSAKMTLHKQPVLSFIMFFCDEMQLGVLASLAKMEPKPIKKERTKLHFYCSRKPP